MLQNLTAELHRNIRDTIPLNASDDVAPTSFKSASGRGLSAGGDSARELL